MPTWGTILLVQHSYAALDTIAFLALLVVLFTFFPSDAPIDATPFFSATNLSACRISINVSPFRISIFLRSAGHKISSRRSRLWFLRLLSKSSNGMDLSDVTVQDRDIGAPSWHEGLSPKQLSCSRTDTEEKEHLLSGRWREGVSLRLIQLDSREYLREILGGQEATESSILFVFC